MAEVTAKINGQKFSGWKTVRVTRGIESVSGSFSLVVSERWANQDQPWPINEEDECSISIGDETIVTGYVDGRKPAFSAADHTLEISGRDKTGDLVDCSALLDHAEFKNFDVVKLAQKLCKPFGINVSVQPGLILPGKTITAPTKLCIEPGETAFNVLEKACRLAALLPISDGEGGLLLTRAGSDRAHDELVEGQNILTGEAEFSAQNRFYKYLVLGQHQASDSFFGKEATQIKATAIDPNVRRQNRVLVLRPEGNVTVDFAKRRAQWEATTRAARANATTIRVQGWLQSNGELWPVNSITRVRSPKLRIDGDMLISQAVYELTRGGGTITTLSMKPPDAFKPEPQVARDGLWKEIKNGALT